MDIYEWLAQLAGDELSHVEDSFRNGDFTEMDLQTRVSRLENQVKGLQEIIRELQAEKEAQDVRVRRAEYIALQHSVGCTCTACLIYLMNKEM
jgi:hypothetical protein